ncbi:hypothetical protein O3G_MSEX009296 [Manduca sexta]|uniref:Uncharacterized protein n=1 Tax=Manduca sexta TaxID=7130 RepID=A0A922CRE2_MANSE|nr:hypothetical protein O3G_MSEX009296 [Manduca sexta]
MSNRYEWESPSVVTARGVSIVLAQVEFRFERLYNAVVSRWSLEEEYAHENNKNGLRKTIKWFEDKMLEHQLEVITQAGTTHWKLRKEPLLSARRS